MGNLDERKQIFLEKYSYLTTVGTYVLVSVLLVYSYITGMKDIVYLLAGFIINGLKDVTGFWFGSSLNSRDKDKAITTLTDAQKPTNTLNVTVPDATLSINDGLKELASLQAIEDRTPEQENRLQELIKNQNSNNV